MKVLFVCVGNIARSQFAEAFYNKMCNGAGVAESAGTKAYRAGQRLGDYEYHTIRCMKERRYDLSNHASKQLTPEMISWADKVIVMAERETWPSFLEKSDKVEFWDVKNPDIEIYETHVIARNSVFGLVKSLLKKEE
ncbi:MAG: low molecular weight phosphatase family protein [Nanoarchaeota archaeon]